jgi:hypothetical protein
MYIPVPLISSNVHTVLYKLFLEYDQETHSFSDAILNNLVDDDWNLITEWITNMIYIANEYTQYIKTNPKSNKTYELMIVRDDLITNLEEISISQTKLVSYLPEILHIASYIIKRNEIDAIMNKFTSGVIPIPEVVQIQETVNQSLGESATQLTEFNDINNLRLRQRLEFLCNITDNLISIPTYEFKFIPLIYSLNTELNQDDTYTLFNYTIKILPEDSEQPIHEHISININKSYIYIDPLMLILLLHKLSPEYISLQRKQTILSYIDPNSIMNQYIDINNKLYTIEIEKQINYSHIQERSIILQINITKHYLDPIKISY